MLGIELSAITSSSVKLRECHLVLINPSRTTSPRAYVYSGPENHKSIRWISAGYPPDEIRFVAIERRALLLAKDKRAFLSVVFISLAGSGARRSLATNRI